MVTLIVLKPPPHVGFTNHKAHVQFQIFQHFLAPFQSDVYTINWEDSKVVLDLKSLLTICGDGKISFTQKLRLNLLHLRNKPKFISTVPHSKLFHFWVNTFFVDQEVSSELTHDIITYSKNLSPFLIHNCFTLSPYQI